MKTRIQIIDDNVSLTTLLAKALAKFGYDPVVENNPLLAMNSARHYLPDLILLDVMMPERDGGRVLADLRADLSLRYVPVILLTAIAREAQALADTGGIKSRVIAKPVQLTELVKEIETELDANRSYNDQQNLEGPDSKTGVQSGFLEGGSAFSDAQPALGTDGFSSNAPAPTQDFSFPGRDDAPAEPGKAF